MSQTQTQDVIGLIPAAGQATRLAPLPVSKELYPIGFHHPGTAQSLRPKVVSHYLLEKMRRAGIEKAYLILRSGKWDIPAYFGDGAMLNMHLGYLLMSLPFGVPYTLDQAYPFVQNARIALGFPDILFEPPDAFQRLLTRQTTSQADVVLGVVSFDQPHLSGMVRFDSGGRVSQIVEKPDSSDWSHSWFIAVWTPLFTEFMHHYLARQQAIGVNAQGRELAIGDVMQAAIAAGFQVEAEVFPQGSYLDIGRPETLIQAVRQFADLDLDEETDPAIATPLP